MVETDPHAAARTAALLAAVGLCALLIVASWPRPVPRLPAVVNRLHAELEERAQRVVAWKDAREEALERVARDPRLVEGSVAALSGEAVELDALLDRTCAPFAGCALYTVEGRRLGTFFVREVPEGLLGGGRTASSRVVATDGLGHLDPAPSEATFSVFFATKVELPDGRRAVLVGRAGADEGLDPLVRSSPLGRTGETYVFEEHGYMITRSRFAEGVMGERGGPRVLRRPAVELLTPAQAPTLAVSAVRSGRTRGIDIDGYVDYRGVVVVGAWRWLEELGAGVVTEIDRAEALEQASARR